MRTRDQFDNRVPVQGRRFKVLYQQNGRWHQKYAQAAGVQAALDEDARQIDVMNTYRMCPSCQRTIATTIYDTGTAHAPGCKVRRSLLAKQNYAEKQKRKERARAAAATRAARRGAD
jgi:hypothetical protein